MKKSISILLKVLAYGLLVPLIVLLLADLGIKMSCKYYWGEQYLLGHSGFKIGMWLVYLFFWLTIIYYIFCTLFFFIKKVIVRKWLFVLFLLIPILFYGLNSAYDYRITVCFSLFHLTYYGLFLILRYFYKITKKMKLYPDVEVKLFDSDKNK